MKFRAFLDIRAHSIIGLIKRYALELLVVKLPSRKGQCPRAAIGTKRVDPQTISLRTAIVCLQSVSTSSAVGPCPAWRVEGPSPEVDFFGLRVSICQGEGRKRQAEDFHDKTTLPRTVSAEPG
jgi:hypothetical protein